MTARSRQHGAYGVTVRRWDTARIAALVLFGCATLACGQTLPQTSSNSVSRNTVIITLLPSASVDRGIVSLEDIADLRGGEQRTRVAMGRADITKLLESDSAERIGRTTVFARLLLAGFRRDSFELRGAAGSVIRVRVPRVGHDKVTTAIRKSMATALDIRESDVNVRLLQPMPQSTKLSGIPDDRVKVTAYSPTLVRPGRTRVSVEFLADGRLVDTAQVMVEVAVLRTVVEVMRPIDRGDELTNSNVRLRRVPVTDPNVEYADDSAIGRTSTRSMNPTTLVRFRDLTRTPSNQPELKPVLVKPRDIVRLVARKKDLAVTLHDGEVLQSGRLGQLIRVRNPTSRKIMIGRVLSASEVEIQLR